MYSGLLMNHVNYFNLKVVRHDQNILMVHITREFSELLTLNPKTHDARYHESIQLCLDRLRSVAYGGDVRRI